VARNSREQLDVARIRALIGATDPWSRDNPLHVTGSALVVDPRARRIILRWHERLGRWLQVGGHGEPGESDPWEVTLREAREETGLSDLRAFPDPRRPEPVQVVVVPVPTSNSEPAHEHADVRYILATDRPDDATPEADSGFLRWLSIHEALIEVDEQNLREFIKRVDQLLAPDSVAREVG
jgi:8-oxo-dGTP pyrophosphatase MutT (NUDIX family)